MALLLPASELPALSRSWLTAASCAADGAEDAATGFVAVDPLAGVDAGGFAAVEVGPCGRVVPGAAATVVGLPTRAGEPAGVARVDDPPPQPAAIAANPRETATRPVRGRRVVCMHSHSTSNVKALNGNL